MKKKQARLIPLDKLRARDGLLFVSPFIIGFLFFFIRPLFMSLIYSFNKLGIEVGGLVYEFVGFQHYIRAFTMDPNFVRALTQTTTGMLYNVPIIVAYSLFIAFILNQKFRGRTFSRAIFFLPVIVTSGVVIRIISGDFVADEMISGRAASSMFETFALSELLLESGVRPDIVQFFIDFINNVFDLTWRSGIQILIFLAGLQSIPPSHYEASTMEGASGWVNFWKITFPMLSPIIMLNLIYTIIDGFTDYSNWLMRIVSEYSRTLHIGYSAALSWVYFVVIFAIIGIVYAIINKRVFYMVD